MSWKIYSIQWAEEKESRKISRRRNVLMMLQKCKQFIFICLLLISTCPDKRMAGIKLLTCQQLLSSFFCPNSWEIDFPCHEERNTKWASRESLMKLFFFFFITPRLTFISLNARSDNVLSCSEEKKDVALPRMAPRRKKNVSIKASRAESADNFLALFSLHIAR